jgi:RNA polymerase sigma-70 factor (ECF subfamily)
VERARTGDPDALATLWRTYNAPLLRYLRGRLAGGAEDLAQQTWLDAARGLSRFRGDQDDFRRWLFTIGRRRLIDELRRSGRRPESVQPAVPDAPTDELGFVYLDDLDRALALVRRLPPDQADAVLLRIVADLDVGQVADIMDRTDTSVRVLVHRGLRRLEQLAEIDETRTRRPAMSWE